MLAFSKPFICKLAYIVFIEGKVNLPRMKYKTKDGVEFEFEGQEDEVLRLYRQIANITTKSSQEHEEEKARNEAKLKLPTDKDVESFIKSQPNCEHDLQMVQKHFFGKIYSSRGQTASMYHRTVRQLRAIRVKIEKETGSKFTEEAIARNLRRYRLEKSLLQLYGTKQ